MGAAPRHLPQGLRETQRPARGLGGASWAHAQDRRILTRCEQATVPDGRRGGDTRGGLEQTLAPPVVRADVSS